MRATRREFLRSTVGILSLAVIPGIASGAGSAIKQGKPNILLIIADDMGYSDSECYGGEVRTPDLSALAANDYSAGQNGSSSSQTAINST